MTDIQRTQPLGLGHPEPMRHPRQVQPARTPHADRPASGTRSGEALVLRGVYVPLITPFADDGSVDVGALSVLADEVLAAGAAGVVALGTTGEPHALTRAERTAVLDTAAAACRARSAVLIVGAHTGEELADLAVRPEVAAALALVPPFLRPGEDGVVAHFAALAAGSPVPLIVYHVPYRTGQALSAAALRRLAALPGVAGVKYAAGGLDGAALDLLADPPPGFALLGGDDPYVSALLALGADGGILASAHVATGAFAELADAWIRGDAQRARGLGHRLTALSTALFAEPNPTVIKGVLHALGRIPTPDVRPPLLPASPAAVEAALRALEALGQRV